MVTGRERDTGIQVGNSTVEVEVCSMREAGRACHRAGGGRVSGGPPENNEAV